MQPVPVVVANGLGVPRLAAVLYGRKLEARGFRAFSVPQRFLNLADVRVSARLLAEGVEAVCAKTGAPKVDIVGVSLGGLVGLYYLKCLGGAARVDRFVSIGGPLNGSAAAHLVNVFPPQIANAIAQTRPGSDLMEELAAAPLPTGVRLVSVGTRGDPVTPRSSWDVPGLTPVETPYGCFPFGHWMLFLDPRNHDVVAELLTRP